MVEELREKLSPSFGGEAARIRCFAHVINLVAQTVITQFDLPSNRRGGREGDAVETGLDAILAGGDRKVEAMLTEIRGLADDLLIEMRDEQEEVPPEERVQDGSGLIDVRWTMSEEELKELTLDVMPARRMIVKVSGSLLVHVCLLVYVLVHVSPTRSPTQSSWSLWTASWPGRRVLCSQAETSLIAS